MHYLINHNLLYNQFLLNLSLFLKNLYIFFLKKFSLNIFVLIRILLGFLKEKKIAFHLEVIYLQILLHIHL